MGDFLKLLDARLEVTGDIPPNMLARADKAIKWDGGTPPKKDRLRMSPTLNYLLCRFQQAGAGEFSWDRPGKMGADPA